MRRTRLRERTFVALTALTVGSLGIAGAATLTRPGAADPTATGASRSEQLPFRNGAPPSPSASAPGLRAGPAAPLPAGPANSLVNDPFADPGAQDTQSETTVVRVGNSDNLVASYNDSGSFTSTDVVQFTGYSTSADGGRTWTDRGALPVHPLGDLGDPVLAYSERAGAVMLATLQCESSSCNGVGPGLQIFTSTDAGVTFGTPTTAPFGVESQIDKEWIAVDNQAGNGFGTVYAMARDFGIDGGMEFIRSTDDGATWSAPVHIADGGQGAFITVTPDHAVQAYWLDGNNEIMVRNSTDAGASFGAPYRVAAISYPTVNGDVGVNGGLRSNGFVHVGVAPNTGALFAVYNDRRSGDTTPDVYVTSSTDGGASWSDPTRINSDAQGDQWSPTIAVAPDGATAMLSWYDRRNDPANLSIQRFGAIGRITGGAIEIGANVPMSGPFPVVIGQDPVVNPTYMGDYDMIAPGPTTFVATWGDNGIPSLAHRRQPDVRAAILPAAPAAADLSLGATAPPSIALGTTATIGYDLTAIDTASMASLTIVTSLGSAVGTPISAGAECSATGRVATCLFGDVADGSAIHVDVPITPLAAGTVTVTATAAHAGVDPTPANDSVTSAIEATGDVPLERTTSGEHCEIPDLTTVECPLVVDPAGPALNVTVGVRLDHTFVGDLQLSVVAPDGTVVGLAANPSGGTGAGGFGTGPDPCGDTTVYTTFRDDAEQSINAYSEPFAGAVLPTEPLSGLATSERSGTWKLRIADVLGGDSGTLLCWSLTTGALPPPQDPPPEVSGPDQFISVGSASIVEGDRRARRVRFPVVLSKPSETPFDLDYVIMACNVGPATCASPRADFQPRFGTLHFGLGADGLTPTSLDAWAAIVADELPEDAAAGAEAFSIRITGAPPGWFVFAEQGFGTIFDDDPHSAPAVGIGDVTIPEGNVGGPNIATVRLTLNRPTGSRVRVTVELVPIGAEPGVDYEDWSGPRTFAFKPGEVAVNVPVAVIPDTVPGFGFEAAVVHILSVSPGIDIARDTGLIQILDDDFFFTKPRKPGS